MVARICRSCVWGTISKLAVTGKPNLDSNFAILLISNIRHQLPVIMSTLTTTFAALGDPTRFAIVERLLTEGELSAGALNEGAEISAPAVSRHLKVLRAAGVIHQRVDQQRRMYSVRPEAVQEITAWTISHRKFWEASVARLDAAMQREMAK